ncbi:MAG: hypothetical protein JXR95_16515, partial [Deltaproteobacteria bacterium]|nr:hypothetical protein [Deltaproteobacteria bacterium]
MKPVDISKGSGPTLLNSSETSKCKYRLKPFQRENFSNILDDVNVFFEESGDRNVGESEIVEFCNDGESQNNIISGTTGKKDSNLISEFLKEDYLEYAKLEMKNLRGTTSERKLFKIEKTDSDMKLKSGQEDEEIQESGEEKINLGDNKASGLTSMEGEELPEVGE